MAGFADFNEEEKDLLAGLIWRVGIHIAHAEDEEGEEDDARERGALIALTRSLARIHGDSPFARELMAQVAQREGAWAQWEARSFDVLPDVRRAGALLAARAQKHEARLYKTILMETAGAVAQAYGEFAGEDNDDGGTLAAMIDKILGAFASRGPDDEGHPMNVSPAEDSAIARIAAALKSAGV